MSDAELLREANDRYFGGDPAVILASGEPDQPCDEFESSEYRTFSGEPACGACGWSERTHG